MSNRKIQCSYCKEKFLRDELEQVTKTKKICKQCKGTSYKDTVEYKELVDYIVEGFKIKKPTPQHFNLIKQWKEQGYSYGEIKYTIHYVFNTLGKKPHNLSLGLIPYYLEEAIAHKRVVDGVRKTALANMKEEVVIVRNESSKKGKGRTRLISIEELVEEE